MIEDLQKPLIVLQVFKKCNPFAVVAVV